MKAREVLQTLNISRPTLTKYVKTGLVKVAGNINGHYIYDDISVKKLLGTNEYDDHTLSSDTVERDNSKMNNKKDKEQKAETSTIKFSDYEPKIISKTDLHIMNLCDCMNTMLDLFNQLTQMRLLDGNTTTKIKNMRATIAEARDYFNNKTY